MVKMKINHRQKNERSETDETFAIQLRDDWRGCHVTDI
jgi:hypothetical protein